MRSAWSDEVAVLVSPIRAYAAMMERPRAGARGILARRIATFLGTVAIAGSLTAAGKLVMGHVVSIAIAWAFVPALHALTVALTSRAAPTRLAPARAIELHMAGNGPYLAFFCAVAGVVLFAPDVGRAFAWLIDSYILVIAGGAMLMGAAVTSYAFYRACTGASRNRAMALLALEWLIKVGLALAWFAFMDNLAPQFLGPRGAG